MRTTLLALLVALAVPANAVADKVEEKTEKAAAKLTDAEIQAAAHVHAVNTMEVDMGKAAKTKATAKVKKYGAMLVTDHGKADVALIALAKKKGLAKIPAPAAPTVADQKEHDEQMAKMDSLKKLKGAEFDKMYLQMMVEGHDKELAKNDTLVSSATDADLKALLEKRKTSLQKHADAARALQKAESTAAK